MIFRERREHHGIIFLRLDDELTVNEIEILRQLLMNYSVSRRYNSLLSPKLSSLCRKLAGRIPTPGRDIHRGTSHSSNSATTS